MILCFPLLNLDGICQATSGPRLDIVPSGMILRMELNVNFCGKVQGERRDRLCMLPCTHFGPTGRKIGWSLQAVLCSQVKKPRFFTFWCMGLGSGRVLLQREMINVLASKCCSFQQMMNFKPLPWGWPHLIYLCNKRHSEYLYCLCTVGLLMRGICYITAYFLSMNANNEIDKTRGFI